ncbi:MAG: DNA replication/repair protein RecF [Anaerovoracaceae bacterium]
MKIKKIKLENYRNYDQLEIDFHKKVNIILGENGSGKTNLLESIYLTSLGKSFRTSKDRDLIKFEREFCRISSFYVKDNEDEEIEIAISNAGKKGIKVNGVSLKKVSELMENIYIVIFSPEDLKIIKEEPAKRRNFIDRELCQLKISYYNNLLNYKKVLAQRNKYLKERYIDDSYLDVWDTELARYGSKIIEERRKFVKEINSISKVIHTNITGKKEEIEILYKPNISIDLDINKQEEIFYKTLVINRNLDKQTRITNKGPHKDDIKVLINNIDARKYGSQGQQRTAALSLKLSEIELIKREKNDNPVLLLDDVMSELDSDRQNYLISSLKDVQIFITTTDLMPDVMDEISHGRVVKINKGAYTEIEL